MRTVLITGAARGIGLALTKRAIARGDMVFPTIRKEADRDNFGSYPNCRPVLMNVADTASVEAGFLEVDRLLAGRSLDVVINSAAIQFAGALEAAPITDFENTINTNVCGSARIARCAIPRLRGHDGRLVFISSLWGRASSGLLGSYCASKHAIESLADSLRRETVGMEMHVVVCEPGIIRTDMYNLQGASVEKTINEMAPNHRVIYEPIYRRYQKLVGGPKGDLTPKAGISAEACAQAIENAAFASRPKHRYRIGMDSKIICLLADALPAPWMDALMRLGLNNKPLPAK